MLHSDCGSNRSNKLQSVAICTFLSQIKKISVTLTLPDKERARSASAKRSTSPFVKHYPNYTLQLRECSKVAQQTYLEPVCRSDEPNNKHGVPKNRAHIREKCCNNRLSRRPVYDWLFRLFASGIAYLNPNMFTFICAVWSGVSINILRGIRTMENIDI